MGRSYRQKIHRKTPSLNDTLAQRTVYIHMRVYTHTHTHIYICSYSEISISTKRSGINTEVYMAQSLGKITQCHKQSLSKLKKANYIKRLFQPQCYETGDQLQLKKKNCKTHNTWRQTICY